MSFKEYVKKSDAKATLSMSNAGFSRSRELGGKENSIAPLMLPRIQCGRPNLSDTHGGGILSRLKNSSVGVMEERPRSNRAFGNVVQHQFPEQQQQQQSKVTMTGREGPRRPQVNAKVTRKPNPNERLWNPSPSKKIKTREVAAGEKEGRIEKALRDWRETEYSHGDKENAPRPVTIATEEESYVIPYNDNDVLKGGVVVGAGGIAPTCGDLNNSFTEKISNLDLGNVLGSNPIEAESATPLPLLKSVSPDDGSNLEEREDRGGWVELLDPDYPYITEILNYWHALEVSHKCNPNYMSKQKEISYKMRTILVDWLVEVVEEYRIVEATLHRCVQFVDRFLSKLQISRGNLQLLGTTCLFIACKVEEIQPPDTGDLVYITDNTYDKGQLLKMECLVLSVLDFDLLTPTTHEFAEYFCNTLQLTSTAKDFTRYITNLTLLHGEKFLGFQPSVLAMAACYVAIRCCDHDNFKNNSNNPHNDSLSLKSVLVNVKRLNANAEFERLVEEAVGPIYLTLLSTRSSRSNSSPDQTINSVCNKYKQFQDRSFLASVASTAACSTLPWF